MTIKMRNDLYVALYPRLLKELGKRISWHLQRQEREERIQNALCHCLAKLPTFVLAHSSPDELAKSLVKACANKRVVFGGNYVGEGRKAEPFDVSLEQDNPKNCIDPSADISVKAQWTDRYCDDLDIDEHDCGYRMADLPTRLASIASLRLQGLSQEKIAARLDVSLRTVSRRIEMLKSAIGELTGLGD